MHTEGRESELLIALAQTRNELAREKARADSCFVAMTPAQDRATEAEQALAAANARADAAEQRACDFQAAAMIDVGNMGGPCAVEPRHVEAHVTGLREALAAARRECAAADERRQSWAEGYQRLHYGHVRAMKRIEELEAALRGMLDNLHTTGYADALSVARAALGAPAAGEEGKR